MFIVQVKHELSGLYAAPNLTLSGTLLEDSVLVHATNQHLDF